MPDSSASILAKNLAALQAWQPDLATLLASTPIDPAWQPTPGTDGTPTYFRPIDDTKVQWLGGTSMPHASAPSLIHTMIIGSTNGLGLSIGTAFEWQHFAASLPRELMLFVYDSDPELTALALRICDLSDHLATGKIVLLVGPDATPPLTAFIAAHDGFEPPRVMHPLPTLLGDRRHHHLTSAEAAIRTAVHQRAEKTALAVNALMETNDSQTPTRSTIHDPRPTTLAFLTTPTHLYQSPLNAHIESQNLPKLVIDRHENASLLGRVKAIAAAKPATILTPLFRTELGPCVPPNTAIETWIPPTARDLFALQDRLPKPETLGPLDTLVVHSSEHADLLQHAGYTPGKIKILPLKLPPTNPNQHPQKTKGSSPLNLRYFVALAADLPPIDADLVGFKLPSHADVWNAARQLIAEDPFSFHVGMSEDLLRRAQRRANITLSDPDVEANMTRLIHHFLLPGEILVSTARDLAANRIPLKLIGTGWETICSSLTPKPTLAPWPTDPSSESTLWSNVALLLQLHPAGILSPCVPAALTHQVAIVALENPRDTSPAGLMDTLDTHFARTKPKSLIPTLHTLLKDAPKRTTLLR